jgi:hypothetical protein
MSDEIPPAPSESTEDATKAETIRITLPPKTDQPVAKRETVRINLPGKPAPTPGASNAPKKETTKIAPVESSTPPAPTGKPFVPPPPKPPSSIGSGIQKPMSGVTPPPKPPSLGAKPTVPLKPTPAPSAPKAPSSTSNAPVEPVTQKAAAPKKETARITLPPEGGKPALPKATVKMQQTQPLVKQPAASVASASSLQPAPALIGSAAAPVEAEPDGMVNILSIAALLISLISLGLVFWAFSASAIS